MWKKLSERSSGWRSTVQSLTRRGATSSFSRSMSERDQKPWTTLPPLTSATTSDSVRPSRPPQPPCEAGARRCGGGRFAGPTSHGRGCTAPVSYSEACSPLPVGQGAGGPNTSSFLPLSP